MEIQSDSLEARSFEIINIQYEICQTCTDWLLKTIDASIKSYGYD